MPIELVLAAHNYECPCIMSILYGCAERAVFLVDFGHADGSVHCDPNHKLPLCTAHTRAAQLAATGGPLMEMLGACPPPDCECGQVVTIHGIYTLKGERV